MLELYVYTYILARGGSGWVYMVLKAGVLYSQAGEFWRRGGNNGEGRVLRCT